MLRDSLSPLETEMKQMSELFGVEQDELSLLLQELENMYRRLYVKSADEEGLCLWESEYGIWHNQVLSIEHRRAKILAKMNSGISATKTMLENLVKQILNADAVKIIEYPAEYRFEIYVHTQSFEENMMLADEAVSEARPAHLAYKFINAIYRKYRLGFYIGILGCVKKSIVGMIDTKGMDFDKCRCGFYLGILGCTKKKMQKGTVETNGIFIDE